MQKEQVVQGSGLRGLKGRIRFGKKTHTIKNVNLFKGYFCQNNWLSSVLQIVI